MSYLIKKKGSDWGKLHVKDMETKKDLPDEINWLKFSAIEWTIDNKGFFYNTFNAPKNKDKKNMGKKAGTETEKLEYNKIFYHRLGTQQKDDVLLYEDMT